MTIIVALANHEARLHLPRAFIQQFSHDTRDSLLKAHTIQLICCLDHQRALVFPALLSTVFSFTIDIGDQMHASQIVVGLWQSLYIVTSEDMQVELLVCDPWIVIDHQHLIHLTWLMPSQEE